MMDEQMDEQTNYFNLGRRIPLGKECLTSFAYIIYLILFTSSIIIRWMTNHGHGTCCRMQYTCAVYMCPFVVHSKIMPTPQTKYCRLPTHGKIMPVTVRSTAELSVQYSN